MEFILMTDIMWIIFYILEPTTMTPKETLSTHFFYTRALLFSDLYNFVFCSCFCFCYVFGF